MVYSATQGVACTRQVYIFFFQAEDGIRDADVTGVQTCALPISDDASGENDARRAAAFPDAAGNGVGDVKPEHAVLNGGIAGVGVVAAGEHPHARARSEERRVGKECRSRWSAYH